jgi:hypothetical protein
MQTYHGACAVRSLVRLAFQLFQVVLIQPRPQSERHITPSRNGESAERQFAQMHTRATPLPRRRLIKPAIEGAVRASAVEHYKLAATVQAHSISIDAQPSQLNYLQFRNSLFLLHSDDHASRAGR